MRARRAPRRAELRRLALLAALAAAHAALAAGPAGVKLDGTLGGAAMALGGPTYNITQSLGRLAGSNLFFSFQYFNIATGETALFSTSSPGINNVISRVTGGYASDIDGTIRLMAVSGAPNFFLVNPSGVTFTSNALIDVPAAFYVTTANYVKFSDGNFYADPSQVSTLSAAAPEAFGFLGNTRAAAINLLGTQLSGGNGGAAPLQIAAGDVSIDGAGVGAFAGISNGGGEVRLVAVGAQNIEVPLSGPVASTDGTLTLSNGGSVITSSVLGQPAGAISVSAGTLGVDGGTAAQAGLVSLAADAGAGAIDINVAGAAQFSNGGAVAAYALDATPGASIALKAGALSIQGSSGLSPTGLFSFNGAVNATVGALSIDGGGAPPGSQPVGMGTAVGDAAPGIDAGVSIEVAGAAAIGDGGRIVANTVGTMDAGSIRLSAASLAITGLAGGPMTGITSTATALSRGNAAPISVTTTGPVALADGGALESATYGAGNAGAVTVVSQSAVSLSAGGAILSSTASAGNAGTVSVHADSLSLDGGPSDIGTPISSSAVPGASGDSGAIAITTRGATTLANGGAILAATAGSANAGDIEVNAGMLSIDGGSSNSLTGISSTAIGPSGHAGDLNITVAGTTSITSGGQIRSDTYSAGNAGDVTITAASLAITGASSSYFTGIFSDTDGTASASAGRVTVNAGSLDIDGQSASAPTGITSDSGFFTGTGGAAGGVSVHVSGAANLANAARISSDTYTAGKGGDIVVDAGSLSIAGSPGKNITAISSSADRPSSGDAGTVSVTTSGATSLSHGGEILSVSAGQGDAGDVSITAASLSMDASDSFYNTQVSSSAFGATGNAGQVSVITTGATNLFNGAEILSVTGGSGNAGSVSLRAGSIALDGGSAMVFTGVSSSGARGSTGKAGSVAIGTPGALTLASGAQILSAAFASGDAGDVAVNAASLSISGGNAAVPTEISSAAERGSSGNAGHVEVTTSGATQLTNAGLILSDTHGAGNAGDITLTAGVLNIDGSSSAQFTGISSSADSDSGGHGGRVSVTTSGATTLTGGGEILSATFAGGDAGAVSVHAGELSISGGNPNQYTEISSAAENGSTGNGGQVTVSATGAAVLNNGGLILSNTLGAGNAGNVSFNGSTLTIQDSTAASISGISSSAGVGSHGNAGNVSVTTSGATTISGGGELLSATFSTGNAGNVSVNAGSLSITGAVAAPWPTGIFSGAHSGSSGNAGAVTVDVSGAAVLSQGAQINSAAQGDSAGQPGSVTISAGALQLSSGSQISIENDATVPSPARIASTQISVTAGSIDLSDAQILASSTGNVAASSIDIRYGTSLLLDPSTISTSSNQGNGGAITISGAGPLWIEQSSITTSVLGSTNGNGGDIHVSAPFIVLATGAIQANTAAPLASGGAVTIQAGALIPSFAAYTLGGALTAFDATISGLNIVQAAAPGGVSGALNVTVPTLDLGNALVKLAGVPAAPAALGRGVCRYRAGSSLSVTGRGGLPVSVRDPLWIATDADRAPATASSDVRRPAPQPAAIGLIACR